VKVETVLLNAGIGYDGTSFRRRVRNLSRQPSISRVVLSHERKGAADDWTDIRVLLGPRPSAHLHDGGDGEVYFPPHSELGGGMYINRTLYSSCELQDGPRRLATVRRPLPALPMLVHLVGPPIEPVVL
jgi:hypothetical protein